MQLFPIFGLRFNFIAKKYKFPASCNKFNPGCWCPRAIFYVEKKIVENFQYFAIYGPLKIAFFENCKIFTLLNGSKI